MKAKCKLWNKAAKVKQTNKYCEKKKCKKEKTDGIEMQNEIEVDKEDLYILKINCNGNRTVGKAKQNVEKIIRN